MASTYGYQALPEPSYVEGFGTEVGFEVHEIEDGEPGSIVCFAGNEDTAKRISHLLTLYGEA